MVTAIIAPDKDYYSCKYKLLFSDAIGFCHDDTVISDNLQHRVVLRRTIASLSLRIDNRQIKCKFLFVSLVHVLLVQVCFVVVNNVERQRYCATLDACFSCEILLRNDSSNEADYVVNNHKYLTQFNRWFILIQRWPNVGRTTVIVQNSAFLRNARCVFSWWCSRCGCSYNPRARVWSISSLAAKRQAPLSLSAFSH